MRGFWGAGHYDARLRLASISDGSNYSVTIPSSGGYSSNGNILAANDSANGNWTYTYDDFNRLLTANATGQAYTYDYDRYGNRWHQNGSHSSQLGFDANNHIIGVTGVTYDLSGNLTGDGTHKYFFDAENRIIQVDGTLGTCSTATACYVYDAEGQRIRKTTVATSVDYLYDTAGNQITELSSTGAWNRGEVYGHGHIATYVNGTTNLIHADWLGTERIRTTATGTSCEQITSLPFGDAQSTSGSCGDPSPVHFTGQQRDSESNVDYFVARHYSSSMGRFMSPDPLGPAAADLANPQTWNPYTYVLDNPLSNIDPNGLDCIYMNNDNGQYLGFNTGDCDNSTEEKANTGYYVDGSVNIIYTTTGDANGVVTGYSGVNKDDPDNVRLIGGNFALPPGDSPPSNQDYMLAIGQALFPLNKLSDCTGAAVVHQIPLVPNRWLDKAFNIAPQPEEKTPASRSLKTAEATHTVAEQASETKWPARYVWGLQKAGLPAASEGFRKVSNKVVPKVAPYASKIKAAGYALTAITVTYETASCYNKP